MSDKRVTIELGRAGGLSGQGYQLSINRIDEDGAGDGYRLFGPKYIGDTVLLRSTTLNERDAREMFAYLRPLLGEDWLAEQVAPKPTTSAALRARANESRGEAL